MALTLKQILAPITVAEAQQFMIDVLVSVGFTGATSWQSGSLARTVGIEVPARLMVNVRDIIVTYGEGGYNDTAEGDWLTLLSASQFDNFRFQAVATQGFVYLSSAEIPHTLGPGELLVADSVQGRTFRNLDAFDLPAHSTNKQVDVEAEIAGVDGNVNLGSITVVQSTLAGVTVVNSGLGGEWITRSGADPETDEQLRTRNRTKWASRAYATPAAGYENYAREADPAVKRVFVDDQNPMGPGSVRIYVAGDDGAANMDTAADNVEKYIEGEIDGIVRRPLCSQVECVPAIDTPVTYSCTIHIAPGFGDVKSAVEEAIDEHFETIPIGGTKTTSDDGAVLLSELYSAVMKVPGVVNVIFSPVADTPLEHNEVALPNIAVNPLVIWT